MALPTPLSKIVALLPGPIVAWVNSWIDLLGNTILVHFAWQESADATALFIVVIAVVIIGLTCTNLKSITLRVLSWCSTGVAGLALVTCLALRYIVSSPGDGERIAFLRDDVWQYSYVALIVFSMVSLTFAILSYFSDPSPAK